MNICKYNPFTSNQSFLFLALVTVAYVHIKNISLQVQIACVSIILNFILFCTHASVAMRQVYNASHTVYYNNWKPGPDLIDTIVTMDTRQAQAWVDIQGGGGVVGGGGSLPKNSSRLFCQLHLTRNFSTPPLKKKKICPWAQSIFLENRVAYKVIKTFLV